MSRSNSTGSVRPKRAETRTCAHCGREFAPPMQRGPIRRYCSKDCQVKAKYLKAGSRTLTCKQCEKSFRVENLSGSPRYCSARCRDKAQYWRTRNPERPSRPPRRMASCERCGERYHQKRSTQRFCTRSCRAKALPPPTARKPHICAACGQRFLGGEVELKGGKYCSFACKDRTVEKACVQCGGTFPVRLGWASTKKFCSNKCSIKNFSSKRPKQARTLECLHCGITFSVARFGSRMRYCSEGCLNRAAKARRKMMKRGAFVEEVSLTFLLHRDRGLCRICKKPVQAGATVPDPLAPTIDHVIPLSKGGEHSKPNCQLAHFRCNSLKRDDQTNLF